MPTYANIGGSRKTVSSWYDNIGGARKQIQTMYANVGSARKIIYESGTDYWSIPYSTSGTLSSSTSYSRMASTSATVNSSGTFTLQSATSTKGRPAAGTFMVYVSNGTSSTTTGTTLYYFYNSTGGYYAFNTNVTGQSSATAVSRVKSTTYSSDVAYDSSNKKLLLKVLLVPNYYRWEKWETGYTYNVVSRGSGSCKILAWDFSDQYNVSGYSFSDEYTTETRNGVLYLILDTSNEIYGGVGDMSYVHQNGGTLHGTYQQVSIHSGSGYAPTIIEGGRLSSWTYFEEMGLGNQYATLSWTNSYEVESSYANSLSDYVFSPNTSAYTVGTTYKNKTTL